ncbi:hypothetical protein MTO96_040975 [Rhipicephalus appendiculatus]
MEETPNVPGYPPTYQPDYVPRYPPTYQPDYVPGYPPTYQPDYLLQMARFRGLSGAFGLSRGSPGPEEVPEEGGRCLSASSSKSRSRSAGGQQQPAGVSAISKKTGSPTWGDTIRGDSPEANVKTAEIKHARNSSSPRATYAFKTTPQPMKGHESEAGSSSNGQSTPKKRAVACEQDGVANQVKFQLRHTFSAISERIKQLGEIFAQLQITLKTQNDRGSNVGYFLENVVAPGSDS